MKPLCLFLCFAFVGCSSFRSSAKDTFALDGNNAIVVNGDVEITLINSGDVLVEDKVVAHINKNGDFVGAKGRRIAHLAKDGWVSGLPDGNPTVVITSKGTVFINGKKEMWIGSDGTLRTSFAGNQSKVVFKGENRQKMMLACLEKSTYGRLLSGLFLGKSRNQALAELMQPVGRSNTNR